MSFRTSDEDLRETGDVLSAVAFDRDTTATTFRTDPDWVRSILPPCFEPDPAGTAAVSIGHWKWLDGLSHHPEFNCAAVNVAVSRNATPGWYNIAMYLDDEFGTVFGRELWGESKKLAHIAYDPQTGAARVTRDGVEIISTTGSPTRTVAPYDTTAVGWEVRGLLHPAGTGILGDVWLTTIAADESGTKTALESPTLTLTSTPNDALGDIPLLSIEGATRFVAERSAWHPDEPTPLPDTAAYLPFLLGRDFDPFTTGAV